MYIRRSECKDRTRVTLLFLQGDINVISLRCVRDVYTFCFSCSNDKRLRVRRLGDPKLAEEQRSIAKEIRPTKILVKNLENLDTHWPQTSAELQLKLCQQEMLFAGKLCKLHSFPTETNTALTSRYTYPSDLDKEGGGKTCRGPIWASPTHHIALWFLGSVCK